MNKQINKINTKLHDFPMNQLIPFFNQNRHPASNEQSYIGNVPLQTKRVIFGLDEALKK